MKKCLERKPIGHKYFTSHIDITDPCYDKDVWCRLNGIEIQEGNYECVSWILHDTYTYDGEQHNCTNIAIAGIYLNGTIPDEEGMEQIGSIGVDAGLAGFFNNKPDYDDDQWHAFCEQILNGDAWITEDGFFTSSGYGDGCYPVTAFKLNDKIVALEIQFI